MTGFLKNYRKLPREVRQLPLGRVLEEKMKQFKESLPLFTDLKNEALRERHWKELMNKTGQKFDINPESFTLAAVFAMELHRFQDVINEIVGAAQKELSIEKVRVRRFGFRQLWVACYHITLSLSLCVDRYSFSKIYSNSNSKF